nr:unnamed protein product [Callosobruchus analis]
MYNKSMGDNLPRKRAFWSEEQLQQAMKAVQCHKVVRTAKTEDTREGERNRTATTGDRKTEAVIVAAEGLSYAQLLTKVKENVNIDNLGVTMNRVRQTKKGELLLTLPKEDGGAQQLKEAISKLDVPGISPRGGGRVTLHIRGMDGVTSAKDVEEAIRKAIPIKEQEITVKPLKPTKNSAYKPSELPGRRIANSANPDNLGSPECRGDTGTERQIPASTRPHRTSQSKRKHRRKYSCNGYKKC